MASNMLHLALVTLIAVVSAAPSLPACSTPGRVEEIVCPTRLCGPHGYCLAVQYGGPCTSNSHCTSQNCNTNTKLCEKSPVFGRCWANDDCSSNICDETCNRCQAVTAGSKCSFNSDCTTNNCDFATHTCAQSGRAGACSIPGDCLSGDCYNSYCRASQPEFSCTCNGDCVSGSKCLKPVLPDGTQAEVGECFASAGSCCDTDSECGTSFCTTSLDSVNKAVCTPGGAGAPCAADCDCADGGTNSLYCSPSSLAETRGVCAENICNLQVCDLQATCTNAGPGLYKCLCNSGYEGSGLNTGNARAPGCVGTAGPAAPQPLPRPVNGEEFEPQIVNGVCAGSPCVQNFECGSNLCVAGTCTINLAAGTCQGNADCSAGFWCAQAPNTHIYRIGARVIPAVGQCQVNRCAIANGGCHVSASCTPEPGEGKRDCKCDEAAGYFGSGKAKDGDRACVNPCNTNNGGCGAANAGLCVALNRNDVQCICLSGFFNNDNNNEKECIDPCLKDNGGCNRFEICQARGPERETDVACRCRDGFIAQEKRCVVDYCYQQCTGANQVCKGNDRGFVCECTQAGFEYFDGTCVQNHCKDVSAVCGSYATCGFHPAGGLTGTVTGTPSIDTTTTCTCDFGFTGNGFTIGVGTGSGCTAAACAAANVALIEHATSGNCDGSQTTRDYCVLGCEQGYKPSVNPEAQCVGQTQTTSAIEFRPFTCKKEHKHDDDQAWSCSGATCVPKAPAVGWKHDGRIGLRWSALGPSVTTLIIKYQLSSGGTIWTENVTPMPAYATTREITGLTPGSQYAFWLVVTSNEGAGSQTFEGNKLFTRV